MGPIPRSMSSQTFKIFVEDPGLCVTDLGIRVMSIVSLIKVIVALHGKAYFNG